MQYEHTQHGSLHHLLWPVAVAEIVCGVAFFGRPAVAVLLLAAGLVTGLLAFCFMHLTVRDEGDHLAVAFGPLPWFRKRIPYGAITEAAPGRSRLIDGWGIHYLPWRGWTYNLWGLDCVELRVDHRRIRIGSDDAPGLAQFLNEKIRQ